MRRPRSAGVERAPRELGGAWKNLYSITVAVRPSACIERLIASILTRLSIDLVQDGQLDRRRSGEDVLGVPLNHLAGRERMTPYPEHTAEPPGQPLDVLHHRGRIHVRSRGSSRSRSQSPQRFRLITTSVIARPGKVAIHQALRR